MPWGKSRKRTWKQGRVAGTGFQEGDWCRLESTWKGAKLLQLCLWPKRAHAFFIQEKRICLFWPTKQVRGANQRYKVVSLRISPKGHPYKVHYMEGAVCGASDMPNTLISFLPVLPVLCPLPIFLLGAFLFLMDFQELLECQVSSVKYVVNIFSHFVLCLCALCYKEVLNHNVIIRVDLFFYHFWPLCHAGKHLSQLKIVNPFPLYFLSFFHGFCPTFKYRIHFPLLSLLLLWFLPYI